MIDDFESGYFAKPLFNHSKSSIPLNDEERDNIKTNLTKAIVETNRCLFMNSTSKNDKKVDVSVKALWNTWICKFLRCHIGYSNTHRLFNRSSIYYDGNPIYITGIKVNSTRWDMNESIPNYCKHVLEVETIYDDLRYSPTLFDKSYIDYSNYSRQATIFDAISAIDTNSLLNIKYDI